MKENISDYRNDWAKNVKGNHIHILNAESGRKGYYCLGCQKEMVAVRPIERQSYFRHHVVDVNRDVGECVISNRVYREKLAEQILHRLKELKVPAVYKYPPKGTEGHPVLLVEKTVIKAAYVKSQLTFYETQDGEIKWGKNPEIEERYLLVKPDITFFGIDNTPLLFVEFVINHKIDDDKRTKIKRLGINTVQIIIPKVPEDEIEKALKSVNKIKWVYNEVESNTKYIPVSTGNPEGILSIDEEQRKLFEESYTCRTAQLGNLIRTINRIMESQSYRSSERLFEYEISRIEGASEGVRSRLDDMERESQSEIFSEFEEQFRELEQKEAGMENYYRELESRYIAKKQAIKREKTGIEDDERVLSESIREYQRIEDQQFESSGDFEKRRIQVKKSTERVENEIRGVGKQQNRDADFIRQLQREQQENFDRTKTELQSNFEGRRNKIEQDKSSLESKIRDFELILRSEEERLENEFDRIREGLVRAIKEGDSTPKEQLPSGIGKLLEIRRIFSDYNERQQAYERYKTYLGIVRSGAWKRW